MPAFRTNHSRPIAVRSPEQKSRRRRRRWRTLIIIAGIIVSIRIALPYGILWFLNKKLANMPEYTGHVGDLDMFIIGGQVTVKDIRFDKKNGEVPVPFLSTNSVKVGLEWKSLFKGKIVGTIEVDSFSVNFVKGPTEATSQAKVDQSWAGLADDLMPLQINSFEVKHGEVHYRDFHSLPKIDVELTEIYVLGKNLGNVNDTDDELPGEITMTSKIYRGTLEVKAKINPMKKEPVFDINASLKNLHVPSLNDLLKGYIKVDVERGTFSLYAEVAAKDNLITGYAKPIMKDLEIRDAKKEKNDPLGEQVLEALTEFGVDILENDEKKQVATKVEIRGAIKDPNLSVLQVAIDALVNAFIEAIVPSIDGTINLNSVKGGKTNFFKELVKPDAPEKKKKKKK